MHRQMRWGIAFPVVAGAIAATMWFAVKHSPPAPALQRGLLPWSGLILAVACFLVGHVSYPRIHNLKVYLAGWLSGVCALAYFVTAWPPRLLQGLKTPPGFACLLMALILAALLAVALVPSFVKYHVTKFITWSAAFALCVLIVTAAMLPAYRWLPPPAAQRWIAAVLTILIVALSVWKMREQFYLGGILSGTALIYASAWMLAPGTAVLPEVYMALGLAAGMLFFQAGILFHWFVRIEHRVKYDPLLHVYNREYCTRILSEQSKLSVAPPFTIAMIDIDHFKKVNDTYGHQAGDAVLYTVAQTILRAVIPSGTLCRYGGEELAVFFPQHSAQEARAILEETRVQVQKARVGTGRKRISVTVSCGISTRTEATQTLQEVLQAADKALYRAKQGGRNQVRIGATRRVRRK